MFGSGIHDKTSQNIEPGTRKVQFERLRYNLDDLFNHTPIFDTPLPDYSEKRDQSWTKIANAIFDPFGKINEYVERIRSTKRRSPRKSK